MTYDERNDRVILGLHPAMRHKAWQMLEELLFVGEDALITSGFRTEEQQTQEYAKGRTGPGRIVTYSKPGWSFHNYGLAIDLVPIGPLGVELSQRNMLEWVAIPRYETYGRVLQGIGFQWGFQMWGYDRPHFQYCVAKDGNNLTIDQVRSGFLPDVERARQERRTAILQRIEFAEMALEKEYLKPSRRRAINRFIPMMEERLLYI